MPAFDYIVISRTYGVSDDDLKEVKNKLALQAKNILAMLLVS